MTCAGFVLKIACLLCVSGIANPKGVWKDEVVDGTRYYVYNFNEQNEANPGVNGYRIKTGNEMDYRIIEDYIPVFETEENGKKHEDGIGLEEYNKMLVKQFYDDFGDVFDADRLRLHEKMNDGLEPGRHHKYLSSHNVPKQRPMTPEEYQRHLESGKKGVLKHGTNRRDTQKFLKERRDPTQHYNEAKLAAELQKVMNNEETGDYKTKETSRSGSPKKGRSMEQGPGDILWTYYQEGGLTQFDWQKYFKECGGHQQSPININTNKLKFIHVQDIKFGHGYFENTYDFEFQNNGHGLAINVVGGEQGLTLSEGILNYTYALKTVQFIYPSMHSVNERIGSMEILFIHAVSGLTIQEALRFDEGVLIMSVLVRGVPETPQIVEEKHHVSSALLSLTSHSALLGQPRARFQLTMMYTSLISLIPLSPHHFFVYKGSLPYPPCTEGVTWMVNRPILKVPRDVLNTVLYNLRSMKNALTLPIMQNNRRTQKTNDRQVTLMMIGGRPQTGYDSDGYVVYL